MKNTFENWLIAHRIQPKIAKTYTNKIKTFENWATSQAIKTPEKIDYPILLKYIEHCRTIGNATRTIQQKIGILRKYFTYHNHPNNPADEIHLKGSVRTLPNIALTLKDLDGLYENYQPFNLIGHRNKIMLGMVIYQGISSGELERLELEDLQLQKGTLYIKGTRKTNNRTLELKAFQLLDLQNYLIKIRPEINKISSISSSQLFTSMGKGTQLHNAICVALKKLKRIEPKLKNFQQIRTCVISNWVKEHGLRKAQYLAGHKYVSSTEKYQFIDQENLLNQLDEKHPF